MFVLCVEMANSANTNTVVRTWFGGRRGLRSGGEQRPDRAGRGRRRLPRPPTLLSRPRAACAASASGGAGRGGLGRGGGGGRAPGSPEGAGGGRAGAPAEAGAAAGRLGRGERAVPAWTPPAARRRAGGGAAASYHPLARPPPNRREKGLPRAVSKKKKTGVWGSRAVPLETHRDPLLTRWKANGYSGG